MTTAINYDSVFEELAVGAQRAHLLGTAPDTMGEPARLARRYPAAAAVGAKPVSQYDAVFEDVFVNQQRAQLLGSLHGAAAANPDQMSEAARLARRYRAPADVIYRNLEEVKRRDAVDSADAQLGPNSPVLRLAMSNPMLASQAIDDVGVLSKLEGFVGSLAKFTLGGGFIGAIKATDDELIASTSGVKRAVVEQMEPFARLIQGPDNGLASLAKYLGDRAAFHDEKAQDIKRRYGIGNDIASGGASSGVGSFVQSSKYLPLALFGGPAGASAALVGMSLETAGQSYNKARAKGVGPNVAAAYAAFDGFVEYVTEVGPFKGLLNDVKAGAPLVATLLRNAWAENKGEQVATLFQDASEWAVINPEKTLSEFIKERPAAVIQTFIATLFGAGGNVALAKGLQQAADLVSPAAAQERLAGFQHLEAALAAATESKLRERNPEAFRELLQSMADANIEDGTPSTVFVDAEVLKQMDPAVLAQVLPSAAAQMQEAGPINGLVEVPLGELLANTPGSALEQSLLQNIRLTPQGETQAEAKAASEQAQEYLQQQADAIVAQASDRMVVQQSADNVKQIVLDQLAKTKRFRPDVNEPYAATAAAFFTVLGNDLGITPEEAYARYPLRVQAVNPAQPGELLNKEAPATQEDFTREALPSLLDKTDWAVLTAEDPGAAKATPEQNAQRMAELKADLDALGVKYQDVVGKYGDVQRSVIITGITEAQAAELGRKYGQESVLTRRGLVYMDGRLVPATGVETFDTPPEDFYTEVPGTGAYFSVSLNFDALSQSAREEGDTRFRDAAIKALAELKNIPTRSAVGIMRGDVKAPKFKNIFQISEWFTKRNQRGMEDMTDAATKRRMLDSLEADLLYSLTDTGSAVGWYDAKVKAALAIMAEVHPEIATDEAAKFGFITILAITSNQTKVNENFALADALYTSWKTTGVFPTDVGAVMDTRAKTEMSKSLAKMAKLGEQHGPEAMREFMTTRRTVRDITKFTGYKISGEGQNSMVYGAAFLGPKIGAFFNNLYGNFDTVTMDRWFMRTINRTRGSMLGLPDSFGDMVDKLEEQFAEGIDTFGVEPSVLAADIAAYRALPEDKQGRILDVLQVMPNVAQYAKARLAVYAKGEVVGGKKKSYYNRTAENLLAKNMSLALNGDMQTPRSGSDRELMRELVFKLQHRLQSKGIDMVVADIQAALWYYEKDLFAKLKGETAQADLFGEAQEAEDYETAARRVLAARRGDQGRDAAGPAGRARPTGRAAAQQVPARQFAADPAAGVTGDLFAQSAVEEAPQPKVGIHFSTGQRSTLDGRFWGSGLKGAERERLNQPGVDPRLRERVAVYIDTGNGIRPEAGVGGYAHEVVLPRLYDATRDPLKLKGDGANAFESRVLDAGYAGYWVPDFTTEQGAAVILGPASRGVQATPIEAPGRPSGAPTRAQDLEWQVYATDATPEAARARADRMQASGKWGGYELQADGPVVKYRKKESVLNQGQTDTPSFKAWFDDSKVVGKDGRPRVMYHGTGSKEQIDEFRPPPAGGSRPQVMFFSPSKREAAGYAARIGKPNKTGLAVGEKGAHVLPVYLKMSNPLDVNDKTQRAKFLRERQNEDVYDYAKRTGHDGVITSLGEWVVFRPEQIKSAIGNRGTFDPTDPSIVNQGPRGTFSPKQLTITLLETADLSTFVHELGHFYLEVMADVASQPSPPARVAQDMEKLLQWFGVTDLYEWNTFTLDQKRAYHERFAEAFEQYLLEGKAPSLALRPVFARLTSWMKAVYRNLKDFMAGRNLRLSDDVRQVFDRMLASEDEIAQAQQQAGFEQVYKSAAEAGMTPEEWAAYQDAQRAGSDEAIAEFQARSIRDLKWAIGARGKELKRLQAEAAEQRKAMRDEVLPEVRQQRVYAAQRWLKTGILPDGTKSVGAKLSTAALKEMYGNEPAAPWRYLATNLLDAEEGLHPDVVAEMFGYTSGDELVRDIIAAAPEDAAVEAVTDQRMLETYGDMATQAGMEAAATEAVHNEARARAVATDLAMLEAANGRTEQVGKSRVNVVMKAAKEFAQALVGRRKVRDLKAQVFVAAEARAGKKVAEAQKAGDTALAAEGQRDRLLNHFAASYTLKAKAEVDKLLDYLRKFDKESVRSKLPVEYLDQIDKLLERFDLRKSTTNAALDKRAALLDWIESQREIGVEPDIPPEVLAEANRTSYKELTVDEFRGVADTIKQIEHLARLKNRLLTAKDKREFEAVRDLLAESINDNAGDRSADTRTPNTVLGAALLGLKKFGAAHIKVSTWARVMDGLKDGGPVWEYIIRTANDAGNNEVVMREQATKALTELLAPVLKQGHLGGKGVHIVDIGRSMNREAILAVALNTGNEGNLQRLMGGEGWAPHHVDAILAKMTAADWAFVQSVWDYFETYKPLIAAKERRVNGREPDWVQAAPREVTSADGKTVQLRGGYYPIKYDPRASDKAEQHADAEAAKQQMRGAYTSATTRRSFTKQRADEVHGRPLLYSLDGVYNGVQEVIHDLSWHEWLIDANRLLRDKKVSAAMREHYGPEAHQQFKAWVKDVAVGEQPMQHAGEAALGWMRQGVSIGGLGFNVMSAVIQPLGLTQSMVRIGVQHVGKGLAKFIANPLSLTDEIHGKSEFMRTRNMTRLRELAEVRAQVKGHSKVRRAVDGGAYYLMLRGQQLVDVPTWWGAYEKAFAEGNGEERAVALADQAVIDAQGSGTIKDQAAIERGGQALKLFTTFYSFFNTALNVGVAQTMGANTPAKKAKLAADYLLLYSVPAVLGFALKNALTPGDSGDDENWQKLVRKLLSEQLSYLTGLMFGVRELGFLKATVEGSQVGTDYSGPSGLKMLSDVARLTKQTAQGELDDGFRKALINVAGDLLRLPSAQINRSITGAQALADGKTDNPAAIITGYQEPKP